MSTVISSPVSRTPNHPLLTPDIITRIREMLRQKGLGWVRLRTLFGVEKHGSLYAAAPVLGLGSIPAARNRIRTLERELHLPKHALLVSDTTGSMLTPAAMAINELTRKEFEGTL